MTATPQLTTDLQKLVLEVEDDLRKRLEADKSRKQSWHDEHTQAVAARRTAMSWSEWRDDRIVQAAVSWVLTTVFVRFAEDNSLISKTWFTGPGERRYHAVEAQQAFFREHPELTDREWIEDSFNYLRSMPATAGLVDEHAALQLVSPSGLMSGRILEFWRQVDSQGNLIHNLVDSTLSTRFLGDLYQELSEHAKDSFALLQTPEFVEEFILDQTLTPALKERPLEGFKLIDPTCGSGHFLLGAFYRFNQLWLEQAPDMDLHERTQAALDSVFGVDINAFAVAIARFRLVIAALKSCGVSSLEAGRDFRIRVETGDSLIHGKAPEMFAGFTEGDGDDLFSYKTEDHRAVKRILQPGQYDAVVGNPPYITVSDKTLRARYRDLYPTCKGTYALTVPFMERFFDLAKRDSHNQPAGWVGQITSNSFMTREFGTKLIEEFLPNTDLRSVIDTSGVNISGHGTPTVILIGRNALPQSETVRAVLGKRGDQSDESEQESTELWSSITQQLNNPGFENDWISVVDRPRRIFSKHPWLLEGGSSGLILQTMNLQGYRLRDLLDRQIGGAIRSGADDAFIHPPWMRKRLALKVPMRPLVVGEDVRNWLESNEDFIVFPYKYGERETESRGIPEYLWPWRHFLGQRATFQGTMEDADKAWWEYMQYTPGTYTYPMSIVFAAVATHNHFALDGGGNVFKQTAPVILLPKNKTKNDHIDLLGVLNSSIVGFWLRQYSYPKSKGSESWADRYDFNGRTVEKLPIAKSSSSISAELFDVAEQRQRLRSSSFFESKVPTQSLLTALRDEDLSLRRRMIALQEELDWYNYAAYGVMNQKLSFDINEVPDLEAGERAFEIILARKVQAGEFSTEWFERHNITPITEIPPHWSPDYRDLVQKRIEIIESDRMINHLERPEYKRRWAEESWRSHEEKVLRSMLLDRLETRDFWFDSQGRPRLLSVAQLTDIVSRDDEFISLLELWVGQSDPNITVALTRLLKVEAVPYLAALRLKESGLDKYKEWRLTWEMQRCQDNGEPVGILPPPPEYVAKDFRQASFRSHRGRLDVPLERFISYSGAELSTDTSMFLGLADWTYAEKFLALAAHMDLMIADAAEDDRLVPILAGLRELVPWVKQWHSDTDPKYGVSLGSFSEEQLEQRRASLGVSYDDLDAWRPPERTRRRKAKA